MLVEAIDEIGRLLTSLLDELLEELLEEGRLDGACVVEEPVPSETELLEGAMPALEVVVEDELLEYTPL